MRLSFLVTHEEADYSCSLSSRERFAARHPVRDVVSGMRGDLRQGPLAKAPAGDSSRCQLRALPYLGSMVRRRSSHFHGNELLSRRMASTQAIRAGPIDGHLSEPGFTVQFQVPPGNRGRRASFLFAEVLASGVAVGDLVLDFPGNELSV